MQWESTAGVLCPTIVRPVSHQCPTVYTTSSVSQAVVFPQRDTKEYMSGNVNIVIPFLSPQRARFLPF